MRFEKLKMHRKSGISLGILVLTVIIYMAAVLAGCGNNTEIDQQEAMKIAQEDVKAIVKGVNGAAMSAYIDYDDKKVAGEAAKSFYKAAMDGKYLAVFLAVDDGNKADAIAAKDCVETAYANYGVQLSPNKDGKVYMEYADGRYVYNVDINLENVQRKAIDNADKVFDGKTFQSNLVVNKDGIVIGAVLQEVKTN
jgi:uncharacterized lipoprotein YehR (DUF1307 family)